MKKLAIVFSFAVALVGCSDNRVPSEAERLGYKGHDLDDPDERLYFSTGPGVTNWVPARVLSVVEDYEFTSNELALVSAAGVITPSAAFETVPDGYVERSREPWFTTWSRDSEAFGKKGVCGFISHYNEVRKVWETGDPYFSTYYDSKDAALKALAELEASVAAFAPKKFHRFEDCWVAEYVRLRVMGLCGQRADGTWTCMLSVNDKCNPGCGPWEPVEAQQARVDEIAYKAELKAWREIVDRLAKDNHTAVTNRAVAAGVPLFGPDVEPQPTGDGRMVYVRVGAFPMSNAVDKVVWEEKAKELAEASGAKLGEPAAQEYERFVVWHAEGTNELFAVRLDMAFPRPTTNALENASAHGEWRQLCFENVLPGFEPPPPPQRKK